MAWVVSVCVYVCMSVCVYGCMCVCVCFQFSPLSDLRRVFVLHCLHCVVSLFELDLDLAASRAVGLLKRNLLEHQTISLDTPLTVGY